MVNLLKNTKMIEKLELKHIAPYLLYGLKVKFDDDYFATIVGLELDRIRLISDYNDYGSCDLSGCGKLILRPLSDLTKEIEVNGEKFVPSNILLTEFKIADDISKFKSTKWNLGFEKGYLCMFYLVPSTEEDLRNDGWMQLKFLTPLRYDIYNKLLEWHFDVFGLIESKLAIDINTLS